MWFLSICYFSQRSYKPDTNYWHHIQFPHNSYTIHRYNNTYRSKLFQALLFILFIRNGMISPSSLVK
nr:MAG TPA: hypothetical protein [Caudoviricetes sp.]